MYLKRCEDLPSQSENTCPVSAVRPEAWLSPGPSLGPDHLLLVCHVSGFYPKPVWVTWMRGEQEHQGTRRGEVLPHADGTWYLQTSLDVEAREAAGLSCRVRHSSLEGRDMVIYWGEKGRDPLWERRWQVLRAREPEEKLGILGFQTKKYIYLVTQEVVSCV